MAVRTCSQCGETKHTGEFPYNENTRDKCHAMCRRCKSAYDSENRRKNREKKRQKKFNFEHYGLAVTDDSLELQRVKRELGE